MQNEIEKLRQLLAEKEAIITRQTARLNYLEEQFRLAQHKQFGKSAEGHPGQGELFNEAELESDAVEEKPEQQQISYTRQKPKRKPLPAELPREQVVIDLDDDEKVCDCCQGQLHRIGEDRAEKLEFIPAQVKVIEILRPKYACRQCDKNGTAVQIKQAPVPKAIIPKGIATASLLSQIATSKYQYGLPLYRQEAMFKQYGIELSRKTMADWILRSAEALQRLYQLLRQHLLKQPVLQADETTLQVVKEDKATCYMWLYCSGTDSPGESPLRNIVLYDYHPSRSGQCAVDFLDGYTGYLQVDGYVGYEQTKATLIGCFAHARRKFDEAKKSQPKGKSGKADMALTQIQKLYRLEQQLKGKTPNEKQALRQQCALPLLAEFKRWLDKTVLTTPPKSKLGEAVGYSLNQWHKLIRYTENGWLNIDNNRAERAIKPFVIGRKNWLFANTAKGAQASAVLYSIIETAKANGLTPYDYLHHLFTQLPNRATEDDLTDLLPWEVSLKPSYAE